MGELSLAGEVRPVVRLKQRIKAAQSMGFERVVAPDKEDGVSIVAQSIKDMIRLLFA